VLITYRDTRGQATPLGPGATVPGPGSVDVTICNDTEQPARLPTGADASATGLAPLLDRALTVARHPSAARLPSTDAGLPATLRVRGAAQVRSAQATPYRVTGSLRLSGARASLEGPATAPVANGGRFNGVLGGVGAAQEVTFTLTVGGPGTVVLDLSAVAALDPRVLTPLGFRSWKAWAAARPGLAARKAALDLLVQVAATGARATSYSPYLGADLAGTGSTSFRWSMASAQKAAAPEASLEPRWGAISLAGAAALLVLVNLALVWRRL
jgi:hypothetical protein